MIPKVKTDRVFSADGLLVSVSFKSRSLPQVLQTAAVVSEALGNEFEYLLTHKISKTGKHVLTMSIN